MLTGVIGVPPIGTSRSLAHCGGSRVMRRYRQGRCLHRSFRVSLSAPSEPLYRRDRASGEMPGACDVHCLFATI